MRDRADYDTMGVASCTGADQTDATLEYPLKLLPDVPGLPPPSDRHCDPRLWEAAADQRDVFADVVVTVTLNLSDRVSGQRVDETAGIGRALCAHRRIDCM